MAAKDNMERALVALFAQVPETVARDVGAKVHAAVAEYDADVERLRKIECAAQVFFGNRHYAEGPDISEWRVEEDLWEQLRRTLQGYSVPCSHEKAQEESENERDEARAEGARKDTHIAELEALHETGDVQIRPGWYGAGRKGTLLAVVSTDQDWGVVLWDGDEDPTTFKWRGLVRIRAKLEGGA